MKKRIFALALIVSLAGCSSLPEHLKVVEQEYSQMISDMRFYYSDTKRAFGKICQPYGEWDSGSTVLNVRFNNTPSKDVIVCDPACGLGVKNYQSSSTIEAFISPDTNLEKCQKYLDDLRYFITHRKVKADVEKQEAEKREREEKQRLEKLKHERERKQAISKAKNCYGKNGSSCRNILVNASNYEDGEAQYHLALLSSAEGDMQGYEYYLARASSNKNANAQLLMAGICEERQKYDIRYFAPRLAYLYLASKNGLPALKQGYEYQLKLLNQKIKQTEERGLRGQLVWLYKIKYGHEALINILQNDYRIWTEGVWLNVVNGP